MALRRVISEAFNLQKEGTFGAFSPELGTDKEPLGVPLFFVTTTFSPSELVDLKTAREVLPAEQLDFEAMIQRDLIPSHTRDIVQYLTAQSSELRFFPPLLAAIVRTSNNELGGFYPEVSGEIRDAPDGGDQMLHLTWGSTLRLETFVADHAATQIALKMRVPRALSGEISTRDGVVEVIPTPCVVKLNTKEATMVVVDGQHRLQALKEIREDKDHSSVLANLSVPVCIVWPPWATERLSSDPVGRPVITSLRKLFIDVNRGSRPVSRHFTILLRDSSLSSLAIRAFCDEMKRRGLLKFIEWNIHDDSRAFQLSYFNKLTGVGILENALTDSGATSLLEKKDNHVFIRVFHHLIGLERRDQDTSGLSDEAAEMIDGWDSQFEPKDRAELNHLIGSACAVSMADLFANAQPFVRLREEIESTLSSFRKKGLPYAQAIESIESLTEPSVASVNAAREEVLSFLQDTLFGLRDFNTPLYRTQRFQQGLVAAFYRFVDAAHRHDRHVTLSTQTDTFIWYLNQFVFPNGADRLFFDGAPWLQGMVVSGASIIKSKAVRLAIGRLLLMPLGEEKAALECGRRCVSAGDVEKQQQLGRFFAEMAGSAQRSFIVTLKKVSTTRFVQGVESDPGLSPRQRDELLRLQAGFRETNGAEGRSVANASEAKREFERVAGEVVFERLRPVLMKLERTLGFRLNIDAQGDNHEENDALDDEA